MITDNDVEKIKNKLEEYFVTKDEFKKEMKTINQRFDSIDKKFEEVMDGIKMIIGITSEHNERFDQLEEKLDKNHEDHDDILENHERRLDKVEDKVFATT